MAVPDNNPVYFDPCAGLQPYGRLPEAEQGAEGLVLDPKNYRFVTVPTESYDRNPAQVTGDITVRRDGLVVGTIKAKLFGCYDAWVRETLASGHRPTDHRPPVSLPRCWRWTTRRRSSLTHSAFRT